MNNPTVSPEPSLTPPCDAESAADERARERWEAEAARQLRNLGLAVVAMKNTVAVTVGLADLEKFRKLYDEADGVMARLETLAERGWRQDER